MSQVVGINGKEVAHQTLAQKASDAREALRHLLAAIDAGELQIDGFLLLYDVQSPTSPGNLALRSLDSDLTVAEATYMAQNFIFDTLVRVREAAT